MIRSVSLYIFLVLSVRSFGQHEIGDIYAYRKYIIIDTDLCSKPYDSYSFILDNGVNEAIYENDTLSEKQLKERLNIIFNKAKLEDHAVLIRYVFVNDMSFANIYDFTALAADLFEKQIDKKSMQKNCRLYLYFNEFFTAQNPNRINIGQSNTDTVKEAVLEMKMDGSYLLNGIQLSIEELQARLETEDISLLIVKADPLVTVGALVDILQLAAKNNIRSTMKLN